METVCYCDYCEAVIECDDPIVAMDEMGDKVTLCADCWMSGYDRGLLVRY